MAMAGLNPWIGYSVSQSWTNKEQGFLPYEQYYEWLINKYNYFCKLNRSHILLIYQVEDMNKHIYCTQVQCSTTICSTGMIQTYVSHVALSL